MARSGGGCAATSRTGQPPAWFWRRISTPGRLEGREERAARPQAERAARVELDLAARRLGEGQERRREPRQGAGLPHLHGPRERAGLPRRSPPDRHALRTHVPHARSERLRPTAPPRSRPRRRAGPSRPSPSSGRPSRKVVPCVEAPHRTSRCASDLEAGGRKVPSTREDGSRPRTHDDDSCGGSSGGSSRGASGERFAMRGL